jgi:hypothetical protein
VVLPLLLLLLCLPLLRCQPLLLICHCPVAAMWACQTTALPPAVLQHVSPLPSRTRCAGRAHL